MAFTKEELAEMAEYDKLVEKGIDLYPLTKEQEKASKDARKTHTGVYNFTKRERKPNEDKREIMEVLENTFQSWSLAEPERLGNYTIVNPEREMEFTFNGKKYKIVLSAPRKQKGSKKMRITATYTLDFPNELVRRAKHGDRTAWDEMVDTFLKDFQKIEEDRHSENPMHVGIIRDTTCIYDYKFEINREPKTLFEM